MSRSINYGTLKGDAEDLEEFLEEDEFEPIKIQKIKKKKKFDDGTKIKQVSKKFKNFKRPVSEKE